MRILQLHCDKFEFTPIKKEIKSAEEITPETKSFEEVVVAFITFELDDDKSVAKKAILEIEKSLERIGCKKLVLYPYAHLSTTLASPAAALDLLKEMKSLSTVEVIRAPFGWNKSYKIQVKGHPLAESSKIITKKVEEEETSEALKSETKITSYWYIMTPDGKMTSISDFDFSNYPKLETLAKYESAKMRTVDEPPPHVSLMKKMAIADYEPASDSGNLRFFPNGRLIKSLIESYVTQRVKEYGGFEVETPIMYDAHHPSMESYFNRFPARQYNIDSEGKKLFLRFAACFGQFLMANEYQISYKSLPFRLYELTRYSFRREQSGELVGLRRLRAFTMPDCHAFCADITQAVEEIKTRFDLSKNVISELGLKEEDYEMAIRFTQDFYNENKDLVEGLIKKHGKPVLVELWKERFFYFVLKWEFNYIDNLNKASALSTDQIDVENSSRYGIEFVDKNNLKKNPLILHNSPSGAIERIIYALLENAARDSMDGKKPHLPYWLTPTQVRIIPVREEFLSHCEKLEKTLSNQNIRVDIDDRPESLGKRIRDAEKEWVWYTLVVGEREAKSNILNIRDRMSGKNFEKSIDEFVQSTQELMKNKPFSSLNMPLYLTKRPQIMV